MPCENIVITIQETNEVVEIIVNDFTVSNILSQDAGNSAVLGTDGKVFVPTPTPGAQNHSELNLDDGTNPHGTTKSDVGLGNADNTSDLNKPISNATQTALNGKANSVHSHVIADVTGLQTELNGKLSNDETTYTAATLPLAGTEEMILNDGSGWKKITWNNIKAQLKIYFDTVYQAILVSGTNIKTINGTSILGSGDLVVSGGGGTTDTIAQASWEDNIFNASNQVVGSLNGYAANGGNINNGIASPNIDDYMNFLCFSSGTSANGGYRYLQISPVGGSAFKAQAGLTCFGTFCIYANSSADSLIRLGFNSSSNLPTDAQFGAYLEITGSTAVFKTANNNVRSTTTSGALTYSTAQGSEIPYHFMIHFDTLTYVTVKLVKYDGTVVLNTYLDTNTPPNTGRFYASAMGCIQTAGTNRNILGLSRLGFGVQKPNFLNSF